MPQEKQGPLARQELDPLVRSPEAGSIGSTSVVSAYASVVFIHSYSDLPSFARSVKIKDQQMAELAYVNKDLDEVVGCRIVGSLLSVDDAWNFDLSRASPSMDGLECRDLGGMPNLKKQLPLEKEKYRQKPNPKTHTQTPGNPLHMKEVSDSESKDKDASAPESPKAEVFIR